MSISIVGRSCIPCVIFDFYKPVPRLLRVSVPFNSTAKDAFNRAIQCRRFRWAGEVARMDCFQNFNRRPLGRPRCSSEGIIIRMGLKEIGINSRNWVDSAQNRAYWRALVNAALNLRDS